MASLKATRKNHPISLPFTPSLSSRILDHPGHLVFVGQHKTGGVMDSYYLNLADQMLHQRSSTDRSWRIS
jgi:hypothetical protein